MTRSDPIPDDPLLLLRESAWLNRLARGLCGDRHLAEDLSQEAMLAAWRSRGRVLGPLRPWLAGVVRRLASNRRRAQARRRRRELAAAPAASASAPAADEVVARANLHESVVHAVLELDEPYRTAVLLRYFDDLSCREIAARLGLPIETVRTRVKRGVVLLRARLDRRHGARAAWLGPLSAIAELGARPAAAAGAGATTLAGMVVLMNVKLIVSLVLLAAVGLVVAWSLDPGEPDPPAGDGIAAAPPPADAPVDTAGAPTRPPGAGAEPAAGRRVLAGGATTGAVTGRLMLARDGRPAAGVEVVLVAAEDAWRGQIGTAGHELVAADGPPLARGTSDADGSYRLELGSTAPFHRLARGEGLFTAVSTEASVEPGQELDLGTTFLHDAVDLHGRVRDTLGQPVAELALDLFWRGELDAGERWATGRGPWLSAVTRADGTFRLDAPARAGEYWIRSGDETIQLTRDSYRVTALEPFLEIVADRDLGMIRGVVVDREGQPVAGLVVSTASGWCTANTDASGRFELLRRRAARATVGLQVWRERFRRSELLLETGPEYSWGTEDVRLVLAPATDIALQVVQAPGMTPVEVFDLDMQREGAKAWVPGGVSHGSGPSGARHEGGVIELAGLVPGRYRVAVVGEEFTAIVPFEVFEGHPPTDRLVLPARRTLGLEVVDADGRAVPRARCDLFSPPSAPSPWSTLPLRPARTSEQAGGTTALPWPSAYARTAGGVTGRDGRLVLAMPAAGGMLLRVVAEGFAPRLVPVGEPGSDDTLRVVLTSGAILRGRLQQAEFAREQYGAYLCLWSVSDPRVVFPEASPMADERTARVRRDGTFELREVPPGDWEICLGYLMAGRTGARVYQRIPVGNVTGLRDGEEHELTLDCGPAVPVEVTGRAYLRGEPAVHARLDFNGEAGAGSATWGALDCDADGRFAGELAPGVYDVEASVLDLTTGEAIECTGSGRAVVVAGRPTVLAIELVPAPR